MLQRIQWGVIAALLGALALMGWKLRTAEESRAVEAALRQRIAELEARLSSQGDTRDEGVPAEIETRSTASGEPEPGPATREAVPEDPGDVTARWLARFLEKPADWRHGRAVSRDLVAELTPDEAVRVLSELWPHLSEKHKKEAIGAFARPPHEGLLAVIDLGARDSSLAVRGSAFHHLQRIAFRDFAEDYGAYEPWVRRYGRMPLAEVLRENAREVLSGLRGRTAAERAALLSDFDRLTFQRADEIGVDLAAILRDGGMLRCVESWLSSGDTDLRRTAVEWARWLQADAEWVRAYVLPLVEAPHGVESGVLYGAISALRAEDHPWAREPLIGLMERLVLEVEWERQKFASREAARALADAGDPVVIPTMIGLILADPTGGAVYDIGYFGLGRLTGVDYDESHDGQWWLNWWHANQDRLPAHVRGLPIPDYRSNR